jgi:hypothetical protein
MAGTLHAPGDGGGGRRKAAARQAVILFHASSHALRAESLLNAHGIAGKLIPVPRHLSSDCGICLRIAGADRETACETITRGGVEIVAVHDLSEEQR